MQAITMFSFKCIRRQHNIISTAKRAANLFKNWKWNESIQCRCVASSTYCPQDQATESKSKKKPVFITTPIFYVNAAPHVGHLFTALLADATARWQRVKGCNTLFSTGTDEHGLKIQQAASSAGLDEQLFCDNVSKSFQNMFDAADIRYDQFIRTTEDRHKEAVYAFWTKLAERGHIYQGTYSGWYSTSDEAFLVEDEVEESTMPDGSTLMLSKDSGNIVSWTEETNYKFRLSSFKEDLLHWLKSHPIQPLVYENRVKYLLDTLPDLSVSRDSQRLTWGIPVPGDSSQKIYVWLDALINYLTVTGYPTSKTYNWPPDCQIIGKDILRFHAVYWPAFLIAAGLEPPRKLVVHSHWLVDNVKMSKSLGNVIDPMQKMAVYGVDAFRYFLLKEGSLESDGTYNDKRVAERVNTDLANTLGNLLGRCTAPSVNKKQELPPHIDEDLIAFLSVEELQMLTALYELPAQVDQMFEEFHFTKALDLIMTHLHWANSLVQAHAPWQLAKSLEHRDYSHLVTVLHVAMETLRVCGILLQPVVPKLSDKLLSRLGVPQSDRFFNNAITPQLDGYPQLGEKIVLQKKVEADS